MLPEEPSFAQVLGLSFDEEDDDFESAGYKDFEEDEEYDEDEDEDDEEDDEDEEDEEEFEDDFEEQPQSRKRPDWD